MGAIWRGNSSNLSDYVTNLYKAPGSIRDSFTDVTIILPDKTRIRAHKFVLAVASPWFEAHFFSSWADQGDTLTVTDVESQTFRNFIEYIYSSGRVKNLATSDYWSLLEAGHFYLHKGLIQHCNKKLKRHIKKLGVSVSEEVVDFINRAVDFTIYDELVEVATKAIIDNFPKYLESGHLDKLCETTSDKIKTKLNESTWTGDAGSYIFVQQSILDTYNFSNDMTSVVKKCKNRLSNYLQSIKSKDDFIQIIEDYLNFGESGDFEYIEEEVLERLKNHLGSQTLEKLCDDGNAFMNVVEYLKKVEGIKSEEICFGEIPELDDDNSINWNEKIAHDEVERYWSLYLFAKKSSLTNLEEHCRIKMLESILLADHTSSMDDQILHINHASLASEDKDFFKLAIFGFLRDSEQYKEKENWVTLNEQAIIGIRDNFEKFDHIQNEEILVNLFYWCKKNSNNESEAKEKFLNILGPGLI